ncbi:MAG: hypothetical protein AAFR84_08770 [Pseudomonadota bacterium]
MTRSLTILAAAVLVAPLLAAGPAAAKGDGGAEARKALAAAQAEARDRNHGGSESTSFFGTLFGLDDRAEEAAEGKAKARKTDE